MPINDPTVTATCDKCGCESDEMELCALTQNAYDLRYVKTELQRGGWLVKQDGQTICDSCIEEERENV